MSWFSKLTGGKDEADKSAAPAPTNPREHERFAGSGERLLLCVDSTPTGEEFPIKDVSSGGFAVSGYNGPLKGNQYFEFRFMCQIEGAAREFDGITNVVRVKDGMLAAKFTPQPRIRTFMREYLASK